MKTLNKTYREIDATTDVLSFPLNDPSTSSDKDIAAGFSPDRSSPDKVLRIGDVVVSYPQAVLEAAEENVMVDKKIEQLIVHGLDHLMGIDHNFNS